MIEEWKPVREFPDHYEISSLGRLRPFRPGSKLRPGMSMKPQTGRKGYISYNLTVDGKVYRRDAHRMVADAFLGPIPDGMQVNHKDGNKANPHLDNLEIATNGENRAHSYRVLGIKPNGTKLTAEQRQESRAKLAAGVPRSEIAEAYGVSRQAILNYTSDVTGPLVLGRASPGERNGSAKLTEDNVREIRGLYAAGGVYQYELAERFGVTQGLITKIVTRRAWGHVE